ncbi:MAG: hypothetical protein ACR2KK_04540 [Acidimicrobiales bacterium]
MAPKSSNRRSATRTERRQAEVRRRRQLATARTTAVRRSVRRKRRLKAGAALAVVAAVAGGAVALTRGGDDGPSRDLRAQRVAGARGRLPIATSPAAYHVVYRAEAYQGANPTVSTEEIWVQRPFDGRVAIREGEPPGTAGQFEGRSTFAVYANYTEAGAAQVAGDAPTVALGDIRVGPSLDELVSQDLFVPGDRRRLLGRECQTYRTGSPLQSLKITAPTATDYVDVCLDDAGLILEEVVIAEDELKQRLTAVSFEKDPAIDPAGFVVEGQRVGVAEGGSEVTEIDRSVAPTPGYWAVEAVPPGFTHRGRYLVAGAQSSHVDVYVRGIDLVSVRQGLPPAEPDLADAGPVVDVDLGALGAGRMLLRSIGPTLIAHPGGEAFVHVTGTLAPGDLRAIAGSLRRS